ncbi:hypothetical protein FHEFKHOI_01789 [Candidatus Methanoperedenaceae archaeon GB50]|nr:MAG: hypothetical protein KBONHNOK_00144 [Candidatus Methanoperedenaceae archaeon GB50]CAD7770102.1 hypothetical protein AIOGIFDO_00756 [Candidatus Methanoperedenaceae archaeon GB37]CAD7768811.1 hypothetical protein FHEFKHOI_00426 [Candidatus Methanoperedenaceae archaeon GB50]CAD7770368.1 hypothetical protein FHEFKHOI_00792 [Candidatus Methanoperedenaceae archaeon GB50]CAD7770554.1 MAG: hypothetical protein KBONHNOK_00361 [Candidatus Methanoperedenaceae archaeon GB50]
MKDGKINTGMAADGQQRVSSLVLKEYLERHAEQDLQKPCFKK